MTDQPTKEEMLEAIEFLERFNLPAYLAIRSLIESTPAGKEPSSE